MNGWINVLGEVRNKVGEVRGQCENQARSLEICWVFFCGWSEWRNLLAFSEQSQRSQKF